MVKYVFIYIFLFTATLSVTNAQPGEICNWDSDKQATVVLTFDDWSPGHYPIVVPELKSRSMVATFFPMISSIADWNHPWPDVREAVSNGNEMGNHSNSHPKLTEQSAEQLSEEIRGAKNTLDNNLTTQTVITFDYPFGDYNNQVIDSVKNSGHIAGRGVNSPTNYTYNFATTEKDYYELQSYSMGSNTSTQTFTNEVDNVVNGGGLLIYMYHSVDDANGTNNDNWYAKVVQDSLQKQFDALLSYSNKIWVTTLGQAIKYHRQANCASLSEVEPFNGKEWVINLTDTLSNNSLYNQPLSLKVKMNGAGFNEVSQNGNRLLIDSVFNDTILFKAVPDAGNITLNIAQRDTILADNNLIEYTGRIDFSNSLAPKFSYSGVSIRATFNGTSISAILDDDTGENYYNVIVDGEVTSVINVTKGKKEYFLAENLEDKSHEIELFKRTELTFGKTQFYGFTLDEDNSLLPIANQRELFIEYIGNSITCGYGNEGENGEDFLATTENHHQTYAAITSRNFNARHMAVSRSGIGVYRNYDGPTSGNDECMPNLYTNTFLYDNNPKYEFAVQPNLVCINLGTNDFSTNGGDSTLYINNYFRLIDTIQAKYNMPEIVCLLGSMMSGNTLSEVRSYLQFIADSASRKGKGNVSFFEMSAQTGDLGIGVHYHPTVAQHQRNASELTEYIRTLMNWKVTPQLVSAKTISTKLIQVSFNTNINSANNDYSGFSFTNGATEYTIESVAADETDGKVLNFIFNDYIEPTTDINLHYEPGTIESPDTIRLDTIDSFNVNNTLTETSITDTDVKTDGTFIKLLFNKRLSLESTIDGLSFSTETKTFTIDSFTVASKYLISYITPTIRKADAVYANYNGSGIFGINDEVVLNPFSNMTINTSSIITSINNTIHNELFTVWPNPNKDGIFYYKSDQLNSGVFTVVNRKGSIISKGKLDNIEGQLSLGNGVPSGVYFMRIDIENQIETHELLIIN